MRIIMKSVLLLSNFGKIPSTEVLLSYSIESDWASKGWKVKKVDLSGSNDQKDAVKLSITEDTRKTGSVGGKAYKELFNILFHRAKNEEVFHYVTKGYTRPSLFYLFMICLIGKLLGKRVVVTLLDDFFSFIAPQRSRWNGYPLLWASFSLADKVFCESDAVAKAAYFYKRDWKKFTVRAIPLKAVKTKGRGKKTAVVFANERDYGLLKEICERPGRDADVKVMFFSDMKDKEKILEAISMADIVVEKAVCNGQIVLPDLAAVVKYPEEKGNQIFLEKGFTVIKGDNDYAEMYKSIMENVNER